MHLTQIQNSNNINDDLIGLPGYIDVRKDKVILKEKNILIDSANNLSNIKTQINSTSTNICGSPLLNIGSLTYNTSRINSYPSSSNPSNNNLTNLTDFNFNNNAIDNTTNNVNNTGNNLFGINISNKSNFVTTSNVPLANNNLINTNINNLINSNSNNNFNNMNNLLNHFTNPNSNYCNNYVNDFPEIYKSTEEFMENFYSLVNMLKGCINEIINNEYTIRSLSNIIKTMSYNQQIIPINNLINSNNLINGNIDCPEIKEQNYSDILNNNKQNK